jgi:repressor LexA
MSAASPAMTDTQREILKFIRETCEATGISPSFREIQNHFGYRAVGTVQDHVRALMKKGHLEESTSDQRRARGLIPKGFRPESTLQIPIYGEIAAGSMRESDQIELGQLTISSSLANGPCFGLRVVGDSMQEIGILEGDILIVHKQNRAKSGDIVAALLNGETTVKRYVQKDEKIFLVPENRRLKPIEVTQGDFQIQGKVVGLQRRF